LERGDPGSVDRPEFSAVRLIVQDLKQRVSGPALRRKASRTPMKWFNGPDAATIYAKDAFNRMERYSVAVAI